MSIKENPSGTALFLRDARGGTRAVGVWTGSKQSAPGDAWFKAATESISVAEGFRGEVHRINSDPRLSPVGRAEEIRTLARDRLQQIGGHAKRTADVRRMVRTNLVPLAPFEAYKQGDYASVMIDIALAQTYRQSQGAEREALSRQIAAGTNPQLAAAVLRLPQALSGVSENILDIAKRTAISQLHPVETERREEIDDQGRVVANALHEALWDVAEAAGLRPNEVRQILGENAEHLPVITRTARGDKYEPLEPVKPEVDAETAAA